MNNGMNDLVGIILRDFPSAQAICLFGSHARGEQRTQSDIDLAMLLPVDVARAAGDLRLSDTAVALSKQARRDVDLVTCGSSLPFFKTRLFTRVYCCATTTSRRARSSRCWPCRHTSNSARSVRKSCDCSARLGEPMMYSNA